MHDLKSIHRHLAGIEAHWLDDAKRDLNYNRNRQHQEQRRGDMAGARFYREEADWDARGIRKRMRILNRERRLGR